MTTSKKEGIDEVGMDRLVSALVILSLARKINAKELEPNIQSREIFLEAVQTLGRSQDDAFEMHIDTVEKRLTSINRCIKSNDHGSALVLLGAVLESEFNAAIRILLRVKNYSHGSITDAIKGVDFKTKINVILPLLQIVVPERLRQISFEQLKIRNQLAHFKARPDLYWDGGETKGDHEVTEELAKEFFLQHPFKVIEEHVSRLVDSSVSQLPEARQAHDLLRRFALFGIDSKPP